LTGSLGGIAGGLAGYEVRKRLVRALKVPDFVMALLIRPSWMLPESANIARERIVTDSEYYLASRVKAK